MTPSQLTRLSWIAQLVAAATIGQTLYFKFTAHPDSVKLFTELGMEPHGRLTVAVLELLACILLLTPRRAAYGALLAAGLMAGAIASHLTHLGWQGPRLHLGALALLALACCLFTLMVRRRELPFPKAPRPANRHRG